MDVMMKMLNNDAADSVLKVINCFFFLQPFVISITLNNLSISGVYKSSRSMGIFEITSTRSPLRHYAEIADCYGYGIFTLGTARCLS